MIVFNIKVGIDEDNLIKKAIVKITDNGKVLREIAIDTEKEYIVSPYSKKRTKYQGRTGLVKSFEENEDTGELKVHIKFSDDHKFGWVRAEDLDVIKK